MSQTETVTTHATPNSVTTAVAQVPASLLTGDAAARAMLTRMGFALLARVRRAFIMKARGGTDEAGDRWVPLKPSTIAYSRGRRTKTEKARDAMPSQALTKKQNTRWWALYRQGLAMYDGDKGAAAKRAWGILKREGVVTLFQKYHTRRVEILRDTGLLLNSLSPGIAPPTSSKRRATAKPPPVDASMAVVAQSPERIFRIETRAVIIGTNRRGAAAHHRGVPGRLPQRRLWPRPGRWPPSWWQDIMGAVKEGIIDAAIAAIKGAGK